MSLLHIDGFDSYSVVADLQMEYYTATNDISITTTGGRYSGGAVNIQGYNSGFGRAMPTNPTELWVGIAINPESGVNNSDQAIFVFIGVDGIMITITYCYVTSIFKVWQGQGGSTPVVLGYCATLFVPAAWHWLEAHILVGTSSNGHVELWLDGIQLINLTSVTTSYGGGTAITNVAIGYVGGSGAFTPFEGLYDDWYILNTSGSINNTRLGDCRIQTRLPISDAGPNDGTPSTSGAHYLMVNEAQWSTANSITLDNEVGQEELFGMSALTSTPYLIFGCRALTIMEKSDGGTLTCETVTVSNSVEADGPNTPALNVWCHIDGIQETDPNTGIAWTLSGVNASKVGIKITT